MTKSGGTGWRDTNARLAGESRGDLMERTPEVRQGEPIGPQGAALILELQRIQRAFALEDRAVPRPAREGRQPHEGGHAVKRDPRRRSAKAKKRKGIMRRAVEVCLGSFGLGNAPPADRQADAARDRPPPAARHRPGDRPAGDHRVAAQSPTRRRPRAAPVAEAPRSIGTLKKLAQEAEKQFARGDVSVEDRSGESRRGATQAALGMVARRALENGLKGAKAGYDYLFGRGDLALADDAGGANLAIRIGRSFERELRSGMRVLILGLGVAGGWATLVPLSGAVVVTGNLVVQSNVKKVQHPSGGVVAQISVHDGTHVKAGDLILRLDETQARAGLQVITKQLDEVMVRIARLVAERDAREPRMPPELADRSGDEELNARFASERSLFKARETARQSQKEVLQSRIAQLKEQIEGLEAQTKSNASQLDLIAGELQGVQSLYEKRLAPITRLNALQRDSARLEGERGQLQSTIAETKSKIGEAELQIIRIDQDFRADVIKDLREAEAKAAELAERRIAAQDQLNRLDIRAPTSGIVHQLAAHTVGGVISAGQVVMEIVPDADDLLVEAKLPPKDIDQVKVGQNTLVRLSAFNQRTTPELKGLVSYVSADLSTDPKGESSYYTVRVELPEEEHRRLAGLQLVSGMPAEVFVQTGSRTMMSYLLKPIRDQLRRAFNES
jgi:HlyD family secretion protein